MTGYPKITQEIEIQTVHLKEHETITVWLKGTQVELRVTEDGMPEIFADDVELKSFKKWYSMREKER